MHQGLLQANFSAGLHDVELVTFDVFDTALIRGVARPEDVFLHVGVEARARGILPLDITDFARMRREAENAARRRAWEIHRWVEIRLEEIYAQLAEMMALEMPLMHALMVLEQEIEQVHSLRNPIIGDLFDQARHAGKKLGFLSDMYLDEALVIKLLEQAGYRGYDFVFVSSTGRETKASGTLFGKVLDIHRIPSRNWMHIGDNPDSDVKQARLLGIKAFLYQKNEAHTRPRPIMKHHSAQILPRKTLVEAELFHSMVTGLVKARCSSSMRERKRNAGPDTNFWEDWGYQHVGPLLAGFGSWLVRELNRRAFRDVYFLSRDGHLIKQVADRMQCPEAAMEPVARTHYLYASRRVFNLAAIDRLDEETLDFLVSGTSRMSVRQFLARIEIDAEAHLETVARIGFASPDEIVEGGLGYGRLRALLRALDEAILARARAEFDVLACYFREEGLLDGGDVAIVDLGWHGSLQDAMARLIARMGGTTTLTGYYLGTFPPAGRYAARGQVMHGYLCEEGKPDALHAAIKTAVELFEWVFSAPHGSVCNLRLVAGGVEPVFADFAFEAGQWRAASVMQAGALRFVDDYLALWQGQALPHVPPEEAVRNFHAALTRPTAEEARRLGGLQHAEGFGKVAVARPIGMPQGSLWNPFSYAGLVRGYRRAFWQPGYLRNVLAARKT